MKYKGIITDLMGRKSSLLELVLVAIFLALSVNLVSDSLSSLLPLSPEWMLVSSVTLGIAVVAYSVIRLLGSGHQSYSYEGFFTHNREDNSLIPIPRYRFSERASMYLRAAFNENPALQVLWDKEPLHTHWEHSSEADVVWQQRLPCLALITEVTEYFVLNELSLHLSAYFKNNQYPTGSPLQKFHRTDIPDVLLSNHFLELFSRPMVERSRFIEFAQVYDTDGTVVSAIGEDGALYDKFELILPASSTLRRLSEDSFEIDTSRFRLIVKVDFQGVNSFVPFEFHRYFLNMDAHDPMMINDYEIRVNFDVFFKPGAFLSASGWNYYLWIDSFLRKFENIFEKSSFFDSIGWESALTVIRFINNQYPSFPRRAQRGPSPTAEKIHPRE